MLYRLIIIAIMLATCRDGYGFVLLSSEKARLPVSAVAPEIQFLWDGSAPNINKKEDFAGGAYANYSDTALMQVLLEFSMDVWNQVYGSYIVLSLISNSLEADVNMDDRLNSIVTQSNSNISTAAFAKPFIEDKIIVDCDISIGDSKIEARTLAYAIIHELGHCLGLGHAHSNYNAIMGYSRSKSNLSLGNDDKAGIIYLYPDPDYISGKPAELVACGTMSSANTRLAPNFLWIFTIPLLTLVYKSPD